MRDCLVRSLVAFCLFVGGPVFSEESLGPDSGNCRELDSLVEVHRDLVRVLSDGLEQKNQEIELKKLELAVSYLQFRARTVERLETLLEQSHGYQESLSDSVTRTEEMIAETEEGRRDTSGPEAAEMSEMLEIFQRSKKELEGRLAQVERKAIDLGNQITEERRSLQFLEDFISENLDLGN